MTLKPLLFTFLQIFVWSLFVQGKLKLVEHVEQENLNCYFCGMGHKEQAKNAFDAEIALSI